MNHLIGRSKNKIPVYIELIGTPAAKQIAQHPHLLTIASEALKSITLAQPTVALEHSMGRDIGYDSVVNTSSADSVFYAKLVHETVYTRFVKNGKMETTTFLSLVLEKNHDGGDSYRVNSIWIGKQRPPRPGDTNETTSSKTYWQDHAFVFENQSIQPRTLTKTEPKTNAQV